MRKPPKECWRYAECTCFVLRRDSEGLCGGSLKVLFDPESELFLIDASRQRSCLPRK